MVVHPQPNSRNNEVPVGNVVFAEYMHEPASDGYARSSKYGGSDRGCCYKSNSVSAVLRLDSVGHTI